MALTLETAPRVYAWVTFVEDLTGVEPVPGDWFTRENCPDTLLALLSEAGRTYAPVMLANARAAAAGETTFTLGLDGAEWTQRTFPYQAKCLRCLREAYAALTPGDRAATDAVLEGTGCVALFAGLN